MYVDTLQIGDLMVHDQTFYVIAMPSDGDTPAFVVGYELLRRFAVKVDYEHQSLTFYDGARFRYSGPGTAVPLQFQGNDLLVEASIGNASGRFVLDTGNEFGFMVNAGFTEKNDLVRALGAHFLGYNGRGFGGPSPQAYVARVNELRIGNVPTTKCYRTSHHRSFRHKEPSGKHWSEYSYKIYRSLRLYARSSLFGKNENFGTIRNFQPRGPHL